MTRSLSRGPVMLGIEALELTNDDRKRLSHPLVGGVILFARNFAGGEQVTRLAAEICRWFDSALGHQDSRMRVERLAKLSPEAGAVPAHEDFAAPV